MLGRYANFKGQPRKLVVSRNPNRDGFLYILDRTNGKYLYSKQFIAVAEDWARRASTPQRERAADLQQASIPDEAGRDRYSPSYSGGTNWYSPSYDPATNMFYYRSLEVCSLFKAKPEPFEEGKGYYSTGVENAPGDHPDFGFINAFDLNTLDFAWRYRLQGDGNAIAGVMSTAGGLVAFGNDAKGFEIADAHTGKQLWVYSLGTGMHASPMAYGIAGKQYFAVAAGDDVFAFALP